MGPQLPRIIHLNVGGIKFATARSTLTSQSIFFDNLLSDNFSDLDASTGEAFVDRDGRYFHLILNFLRSGVIETPIPPPLSAEGLLLEAEYFGIEPLCQALRAPPPSAALGEPTLRADGAGIYTWEDKQQPGLIEAICFERGAVCDVNYGDVLGSVVYSRGPCARENLRAMQLASPLPTIWRESADASTIVAFFTQRFISRGNYRTSGRSLIMSRGTLGSDAAPGVAQPAQSTVTTVGVITDSGDELLLLGPDGADLATSSASLLEQLGLQAAATAASAGLGGGLGGGWKRFVWEPLQAA